MSKFRSRLLLTFALPAALAGCMAALADVTEDAQHVDSLAHSLQTNELIFADKALGRRVRRVIAIDLIGHGGSGFPQNLRS